MAGKYLTQEQIGELKKHARALHDQLPEIDRAERAGVNVDALRLIHTQQMQTIASLLAEYGS